LDDWREQLRDARKRLGLSQRDMAARAGISYETVRKYEGGTRHPSRQHLGHIIDALQVDRGWRNRLLAAAGYAPDGLERRPDMDDWWMSVEDATAEIAAYPWPAFVLGERSEVITANAVAQRVWGVDLRTEFLDPVERNLLSIASNPRFADRCLNWDEAVTTILSAFKSYHLRPEDIENPTPYMEALMKHFLSGDPKYVGRLTEVWQKTPSDFPHRFRWCYPVVWDTPGVGVIRFRCLISGVNEPDGLNINDWIPTDEESWAVLRRVVQDTA